MSEARAVQKQNGSALLQPRKLKSPEISQQLLIEKNVFSYKLIYSIICSLLFFVVVVLLTYLLFIKNITIYKYVIFKRKYVILTGKLSFDWSFFGAV